MIDDLAWISISAYQPRNCQRVYARVKYGIPKKVTFYGRPAPRWEGSSIAYDLQYFAEWAPITADDRPVKQSAYSGDGRALREGRTGP
jgi:hypothetical protein